MESRKSKRSIRMALVLGAAVAGTALVGFGGLAAWNAYTENAGNSVAAGTLSHANQSAACVSNLGSLPVSSGTGWCSAVVTVAGISSTWTGTGVADTVKIDNTGSLNSTFAMSMPAAATGTLCGDLSLKVTDKNAATVYNTTVLTTTMGATALNNNAGTPSSTWTGSGTAGTGSGASGNTFTLTVAPFGTFASDSTDASTSCTFSILFTQSA